MITVRPIASCGPIADCTICEPLDTDLCITPWVSSEVFEVGVLLSDIATLVCVPAFKDVTAYACLVVPCRGKPEAYFNCSDDDENGEIVCAAAHDNIAWVPPIGPVGTRALWIREEFCCNREAA